MDKALGYLSLSAKAGKLVCGADNCIDALKRGKARLIVLACDASPNARKRADGMLFGRKTPLVKSGYTKYDLATAAGANGPVAMAAVCDEGLANAFAKCARPEKQQEEE